MDLAERFASGDLSGEALMAMEDKEIREKLLGVRGVGPWTVEMTLMFSFVFPLSGSFSGG